MLNTYKTKCWRKTRVASGVAFTIGAVLASPVHAQRVLEEITVTARKVEESLQSVPISVTAVSGKSLKDSGLISFPQIAAVTPNFNVRSSASRGEFAAEINVRGQTSTTSDLSIDQAVGINVNGAPITRGTNIFGNLFDIEQVEILRGPQGTLFGKNTTGGTVIVRTVAPQIGEFSGYGEVSAGNNGRLNLEGVLNVPLSEKSALRFGASSTEQDGFADGVRLDGSFTGNDFGDDDEEFFRASYLYQPSDSFSLRINADTHEVSENGGASRVLRDGFLFGVFQIAGVTPGGIFNSPDLREVVPELNAEETNINATIEADLGFADFTSITSYREQDSFTNVNYAVAADVRLAQESELLAQELRLAGTTGKLNWQTGLFISSEDGEDFNDVADRGDLTAVENDSWSLFAQGTYAINDKLNLTAGIRYTDEERFVARIEDAGVPVSGPTNEADFDGTSWTVALDYEFAPSSLGYVSVSRGFRAGGIDGDANIDAVVDPEFVVNYEVGFKADLVNDTLRFNTALWYSDYSDIQIASFTTSTDTSAQGVPVILLRNAAEATLSGFEAELEWLPTDNFSLSAGVGYTDGEYDEFEEPRLAIPDDPSSVFIFDRSDEPIGGPELQFNLTARYAFDLTQSIKGNAQFTYSYTDETELASPALSARFEPGQAVVDSISLLNGQIDFDITDTLNVALWGTNLTDEEYFSNGFAIETLGLLLAQGNTAAPRQYGIRVRKDF